METQDRVLVPQAEDRITVSLVQWGVLMERIQKVVDHSADYVSFGWGMFGMAASALTAALTFPWSITWEFPSTDNHVHLNWPALVAEFVCVLLAGVGTIAWRISLSYAKTHHADRRELAALIREDMQLIADRHCIPIAASPPAALPAAAPPAAAATPATPASP